MKIIVLSDTHIDRFEQLPPPILAALPSADLIVHAGDFTQKAVLDGLGGVKEVKAVAGNADSQVIRFMLPERLIFEAAGKTIGLAHGAGDKVGIVERVRGYFDRPDIIIFGHSHLPCNRIIDGVLMFNPGSARQSYGIIAIGDKIKAEIVTV